MRSYFFRPALSRIFTFVMCVSLIAPAAYAMSPQDDGEFILVSAPASILGVNIRDVDDHSAKLLGLKTTLGVEVIAVDHDAPAGKAGIHLRDVIVSVDGKAVSTAQQFRETMRALPPGTQVSLAILRNGKPMKFSIRLADRLKLRQQSFVEHFAPPMPGFSHAFSDVGTLPPQFDRDEAEEGDLRFHIGAQLEMLTPQLASYFGVSDGVGMLVRAVEPDSPAAASGLQAGDVILKCDDTPIVTPMDWKRATDAAHDDAIRLSILRDKHTQALIVQRARTQATLCDISNNWEHAATI